MNFKHLKEQINSIRAHDYDTTNVTSIEYHSSGKITFESGQEEIEELKEKIKDNEEILTRYEKEAAEQTEENSKLNTRINELQSELNNFVSDKEGSALDLIARAANAETSERHYRATLLELKRSYGEIQLENEKLRARKNKANVSRCATTGKLVAEFNGVKYFMEEKK